MRKEPDCHRVSPRPHAGRDCRAKQRYIQRRGDARRVFHDRECSPPEAFSWRHGLHLTIWEDYDRPGIVVIWNGVRVGIDENTIPRGCNIGNDVESQQGRVS